MERWPEGTYHDVIGLCKVAKLNGEDGIKEMRSGESDSHMLDFSPRNYLFLPFDDDYSLIGACDPLAGKVIHGVGSPVQSPNGHDDGSGKPPVHTVGDVLITSVLVAGQRSRILIEIVP
mgnify:FL=1